MNNKEEIKVDDVLEALSALGSPETIKTKRDKFGVAPKNTFGVFQKDINMLAKEIGKNNDLAIALFETEHYDAQILTSKIFNPKHLTKDLMEQFVSSFQTWEACDSFSMKLFARSPFAIEKALEWSHREAEFEKRAGFATMAAFCMANKKADNDVFEPFFDAVVRESWDNRIYVRKSVNWALRNMGKRNLDLNYRAIDTAHALLQMHNKTAQWIANNALKELTDDSMRRSDYPRSIYRPKRKMK